VTLQSSIVLAQINYTIQILNHQTAKVMSNHNSSINKFNSAKLAATACTVIFTLGIATPSSAQLVNGGFESGLTGWSAFNGAIAAVSPVRSGSGSLELPGVGGYSVPGAFETFAASPGQIWDFQGYMLTQSALPAGPFGVLKIVWDDASMTDLQASTVYIGAGVGPANPGIEALPHLDSGATPNTWLFSEAQGVAPASTAYVKFFALNIDASAETIYVDDLSATMVPEPSSMALALSGLLGLVAFGWNKRRV
jgi:hypothetical protein